MKLGSIGTMVKFYVRNVDGAIIGRKPDSNQTSTRVKNQQMNFAERMKGNNIAGACRGKEGKAFWGCLKSEGHRQYAGRTGR